MHRGWGLIMHAARLAHVYKGTSVQQQHAQVVLAKAGGEVQGRHLCVCMCASVSVRVCDCGSGQGYL